MTSSEIRQSFLDFFKSKEHTIVPSSSLMPDSPNLLFTNAGMNQFVPIFLGERKPDVDKWAGSVPGLPTRAADTQKCIRAGGKHNDLDDVGLDTYHHTFFEMLGNWSFGDYFKKEAIAWAWELVIERWKFPPERLYATVYQPGPGDPSEFDQEAYDHWAALFQKAGLDPGIHIVNGDKKDNFWMMGDTGPCGPCSELHVDLTPAGDTKGSLVNAGDPRCIEIWNLVFIQFNANPDGSFSPLPAKHVDTGMGFERVTSIIQGTKNFTDFANAKISNYETDIFRPIFDEIEKLSGKKYGSTLPEPGEIQSAIDIAFRVIADHVRTLSFAIADGIQPGNTDRNYVLRRILRRAVRYGRTLGFHEPFFYKLVEVLARTMGDVFPEVRAKQKHIEEVLKREEETFNRTLDKGIALFETEASRILGERDHPGHTSGHPAREGDANYWKRRLPHYERPHGIYHVTFSTRDHRILSPAARTIVRDAFIHFHQKRYDLFAVCVMPDHAHALLRPWIRETDADGKSIFWSLKDLMHSIKSFSATEINKAEQAVGDQVWENEYHDRLMRSDSDVEEKFLYICRNPWASQVIGSDESYPWLWTWSDQSIRQDAGHGDQDGRAPQISAEFAFRLYDEQGFPLDLTELMARERGLDVDNAGFERLMEEQRNRARAAQKKTIIELSEVDAKTPTQFVGYDQLVADAHILDMVFKGDETFAAVDVSPFYAEMGGQVGDTGTLESEGETHAVSNTVKRGEVFLLKVPPSVSSVSSVVKLSVDAQRRAAIQRHHTVTHLLHWALHEVVSREAAQKGSFVGPDKLTFDFNSSPLTPCQVKDIERLVNERIAECAGVSWMEVPYAEVRGREDIMQFFGDKYGETVRVVQIGGEAGALNGYSMELCAGTHTRNTSDVTSFKIVSEGAIAAGVRRIEAVAGGAVLDWARLEAARQQERFAILTGKKPGIGALSALAAGEDAKQVLVSLEERGAQLEKVDAEVREWEKQNAKAAEAGLKSRAAGVASELASSHEGQAFCVAEIPEADGKMLQAVVEVLRAKFSGPIFLAGAANGRVSLIAAVPKERTAKFQAGKLIQEIAPLVGGKGGGRPDLAQGGGADVSKLDAALAKARRMLESSL